MKFITISAVALSLAFLAGVSLAKPVPTCIVRGLRQKTQESSKREVTELNRLNGDLNLQLTSLSKELPSDEDTQDIQPATNVYEYIANNLVLHESIPQPQDRNMTMLRAVQEITAKRESDEQEYEARLRGGQNEAIREAHEAILTLQAQLGSTQASHQATIQVYIKDRETLKTMLARYEQGGVPECSRLIFNLEFSKLKTQLQ